MKKLLLMTLIVASCSAVAGTNYVFYSQSDGRVLKAAEEFSYDADKDTLVLGDRAMQGIDWTLMRLDMTTDALPANFSNIGQVSHVRVLPLTPEEKTDFANWADKKLVAALRAIVKLVNSRLPAGQKITEDELKQAVREETGR